MKTYRLFPNLPRILLTVFVFAALQGCAAGPLDDADARAAAAHMQRHDITAGGFRITTYSRIRDTNKPVTIYIEGDTRGWQPAADPGVSDMPDDTMGLRLAALDPSTNVVFIAHPCQFGIEDPICFDGTWDNAHLADQVYTSINRAVDHIAVVFLHPHLNLVGYSGGGGIAAVLAARRHDVVSLRTIAGNLDPEGNGRAHAADPQDDFVDPMPLAHRLALIPQEHFVGDGDVIVPPFLTENFIKAIGVSYCVKVTHVPAATHLTGWEDYWENHAAKIPVCGTLTRQ
jgi:pimeloyl-ACP methyl ester carboxylesterase